MFTLKYFSKIGILFVGLFPFPKCDGIIDLCNNEVDLTLYIPSIGSSNNISICLSTTQDQSDLTVELRHNSYVYNTSQKNLKFSFTQSSDYTFYMLFVLKTKSLSDYGAWTVTIINTMEVKLTFTIMVVKEDSSNMSFTFENNKQSNEDEYKLVCKGTNYPKALEIKFVTGKIIKAKTHILQNYQRYLVLEEINVENECSLFGSYVCTMTDYRNKKITSSLEVHETTCEPKLCTDETNMIKYSNENRNLKINICVIHNYTQVNVTLYDMESGAEINDTRWSHVYKPLTTIVGDIELTLNNVKEMDFKMYKVVLAFTPSLNLTQNFVIKLKDHPILVRNELWMPKDLCSKNVQRPLYRKIRSGLRLSAENVTHNDTTISIIHKHGSVDYYVKIVFTDCTQYINKYHAVTVKAGSIQNISMVFNLTELPVNNINLCNHITDGLEYSVQLGQIFQIQICVNSSQFFNISNIGINGVPGEKLTKNNKYVISFERNQNFLLRINNITTDDVKMYVVKIKNTKNDFIDLTFFLGLKQGPPVFCNGTSPQTTFNVTTGETLNIKLCLQSYPELSSGVEINGNIYNSTSNGQIVVQSNFDDVLLQYNMDIAINNITEENMGLYNVSFKNKNNQVLENIFYLKVTRKPTTQTPKMTLPCHVKRLVTNHYNVTITQVANGQQLTNVCNDDFLRIVLNVTYNGHHHFCCNSTKTVNCFVTRNNARGIVSLTLLTNETMNSSLHCNGRAIDQTNCSECYTLHKNNNPILPYAMKLSFTYYSHDDVRICALKLWDQSNQVLEMNITIHFKIDQDTLPSNTSPKIAVYICVSAVTIVLVTSIFFAVFFLYRSRNARKYKVVTGTQHYANIFDTEKENLTDTIQESNGYTLNQDVLLPHKDRKSDLSLNKSSFKKKGSGRLKYVHFGSTSEGLGTDQSTDVTSLDSTIRQCSEESSSLASSGLCRHGPSEQCRCASVSSPLGRYVSKEGLIYLDLSNSDVSSMKSKASFWRSQASDINDKVEYAQLDFTLMKERERKKSKSKKGRKD